MKSDKNMETEKKTKNSAKKSGKWIDQTEKFIDDAAEKIHKSETYRKADKTMEDATKKIFREAGRLWGKSEKYLKKRKDDDRKRT